MSGKTTKYGNELARSFETIFQTLLDDIRIAAPEITDWSDDNILTHILKVQAGQTSFLHYYIDKNTSEAFLQTLTTHSAAMKLAAGRDYRPKSAVPAFVELIFSFDKVNEAADFLIPAGTLVASLNDVIFETTTDAVIPLLGIDTRCRAVQIVRKNEEDLETTGLPFQIIPINELVAEGSTRLKIGSDNYLPQETFAYSAFNDNHFVESYAGENTTIIRLGDGKNGTLPAAGLPITLDYAVTKGTGGNVGRQSITEISSDINVPEGYELSVSNPFEATGGGAAEGLVELQANIPRFTRSVVGAAHRDTFEHLAVLYPGVGAAGVVYDRGAVEDVETDTGIVTKLKPVEIVIVPTAGGEAPEELVSGVYKFLRERTTINIDIRIKSVGDFRIRYTISAEARPNFANKDVRANLLSALLDFQSVKNQTVNGQVWFSDAYAAMEAAKGVLRTKIVRADLIPYAHKIGNTTNGLDWTRIVAETSADDNTYTLTFASATTFVLEKNGSSLGTFPVGQPFADTNIISTVWGEYTVGDKYYFRTYPYISRIGQALVLNEPSIALSFAEDINVSVTGGIQ